MAGAEIALVKRWFEEGGNLGRSEAIDELLASGAPVYGISHGGDVLHGPDGFKPAYQQLKAAFPDIRFTIHDAISEGDMVAVRWTAQATHAGDGLGVPATNNPVAISGMAFIRVRDGKLIEGWNNWDMMGMMHAIGQAPQPAVIWKDGQAADLRAVANGLLRSNLRAAQRATRIVFFIGGFAMAAWAPLVPFVKARLALGDGALGLLLLSLGIGSIAAMPWAGALAGRAGCRFVIVCSVALFCVTLPLLASAADLPLLIAALFGFGAALGSIDVAMNIHAIIAERASGRSIMSGFHGLFSLGGMAGAAGVSALLAEGASPSLATACVAAISCAALLVAAPHLLSDRSHGDGPVFAMPRGIVLFIGLLCFIGFLVEGSVLDWSAVFLTSAHGAAPSDAGLGFAAFSLTMTAGRLLGDRVVQRFGGANIIAFGGVCAATGFALATLVPSWQAALLGYAMVGVGCSNIVPVLFTSVGRQSAMPENVAVPAVTTLGYAGVLAGPAAIGFIAQALSLPAAFLILAVLLLGVAASGRLLRA